MRSVTIHKFEIHQFETKKTDVFWYLGKLGQMHDAGGIITVLIVVGLAILRPNLNGSLSSLFSKGLSTLSKVTNRVCDPVSQLRESYNSKKEAPVHTQNYVHTAVQLSRYFSTGIFVRKTDTSKCFISMPT